MTKSSGELKVWTCRLWKHNGTCRWEREVPKGFLVIGLKRWEVHPVEMEGKKLSRLNIQEGGVKE